MYDPFFTRYGSAVGNMFYVEVGSQRLESSLSPLTTEEAARAWQDGLKLIQPSTLEAFWRWIKRG